MPVGLDEGWLEADITALEGESTQFGPNDYLRRQMTNAN